MMTRRSALKDSSRSATKLLNRSSSQTCQETRSNKQPLERSTASGIYQQELSSFHSTHMLEATFSSISSIQISQQAVSQSEASHATSSEELHRAHTEQTGIFLQCLFYFFVACYVDSLIERLILILERNIYRFPFLMRIGFVKALVKPSNGKFRHNSTLCCTQNILEHVYANDTAVETLSPVRIVEKPSFPDPSDDWGHFADFQEEVVY